ncbi:hypothetical protein FNF28_06767 [Cafeteria roenbergensis]|uniref:DNA mismatch repair protein MSH3 n=1 Tax=Cafeteria roenbergensis TaxID=33653 RepID=A0A5A8CPS0_CAFRO|nr:hypothetical protein FNF28_06767 [Cafeteria roenbergensis]
MARFAAAGSAAPSRAAGPAAAPSLPPPADAGKLTPLEQQVAALLRHHPGLVLLVECGYKFRFFGRGAVLAARALGIWAHMDRAFMTASVPAFRVGPHVRRLVAAGFAVGVVKQAETAAIKRQSESRSKLFERRLSAVYTRGTLTADALLAAPSGHSQPPASAAGAGADDEGEEEGGAPAAGDARTGILACVVDLPAAADGAAPGDAAPGISAGAPADAAAAPSPGRKRQRDSADACPRRTLAVVAVDLATASITWDVFHDDVARTSLTDRLDIIQPHELLLQPEDPSDDPASLRRTRLAAAQAAAAAVLAMLSAAAGGTGTDPSGAEVGQSEEDKARAAAAAAFGPRGSKGARFAAAAARARSRRVPLTSALSLEAEAAWFPDVAAARLAIDAARRGLDDALAEAAGVLGKPGLQFRSLRTGVSSQLECLIEVSKRDPHRDRVPAEWAMVSTTSAVVRYHTPAVLGLLEEQARGRERLQLSCEAAWAKAQAMMTERYAAPLRAAASAAASFDALASLAAVARLPGYCRPLLLGRSHPAGVWATAARHPVAEQAGAAGRSRRLPAAGPAAGGVAITGVYVPNAYAVGDPAAAGAAPAAAADVIREACACVGGGARVTVLTGPNMNGKSSYTRGAALLAVMAQAGSFVPAERCVVSVLDAVFTRMGSTDDLEGGMSTFLVEMAQAASVLREATPRSLVVMDELGRGTATHDGTAIATATLERVVTRLRCPSLFVTHYPELSAAAARLAAAGHSAANAHMAYLDADQAGSAGVVLLYRVQAGAAERSYGLDVARMAGLPAGLLDTAAAFAAAMRRCTT